MLLEDSRVLSFFFCLVMLGATVTAHQAFINHTKHGWISKVHVPFFFDSVWHAVGVSECLPFLPLSPIIPSFSPRFTPAPLRSPLLTLISVSTVSIANSHAKPSSTTVRHSGFPSSLFALISISRNTPSYAFAPMFSGSLLCVPFFL